MELIHGTLLVLIKLLCIFQIQNMPSLTNILPHTCFTMFNFLLKKKCCKVQQGPVVNK